MADTPNKQATLLHDPNRTITPKKKIRATFNTAQKVDSNYRSGSANMARPPIKRIIKK